MHGSETLPHEDARRLGTGRNRLGLILLMLKITRVDSPLLSPSVYNPGTSSNADVKAQLDNREKKQHNRRGIPPMKAVSSILRESKHSLVQSCSQDVFAIWRELHERHWRIVIIYREEKKRLTLGRNKMQVSSQLPMSTV